jgi:hypothetical protein
MFTDLGGELPVVTRLVVSGWLGVAVAVIGAALTALLARRSVLGGYVAGVGLVMLTIALFLVAAYLPIFSLAGKIR